MEQKEKVDAMPNTAVNFQTAISAKFVLEKISYWIFLILKLE